MRTPVLARRWIIAAIGVGVWSGPEGASFARAQSLLPFDARTWRPSSDAEASLVLEPAATPGAWQWNVGAWSQYAEAPVTLRLPSGTELSPVKRSVALDLVAGLGLGDRASIGVDVPLDLWQEGDSAASTGLGNVTALAKVTVISNDRQGVRSGLGVAALGAFSMPGGQSSSFFADRAAGASLRGLVEYALGIGAARAEIGYDVRGSWITWPASAGGPTFGNTIPWAIGAVVRPKALAQALDGGDRQLWELALHGSLPGGPAGPFGWNGPGASLLSPLLLALSDRIALGHDRDLFVLGGADVGLDHAVGVPILRAVIAVAWSPRSHDRDGDGVPDERDECPDLPEDHDGIQDADGCPEDDADGDDILDQDDACPLVPGVPSNDPKKNGCPGGDPVTAPASTPKEPGP